MRTSLVVMVLFAAALAGCADAGGDKAPVDESDFADLDLQATDDTGIIRGVVVDETITPVKDAVVAIQGTERTAVTNEVGVFGFAEVAPGTHFLEVTKPGYKRAQQNVEVVAGERSPPIVKVLLERDPVSAPFVEVFQFNGFIECSFSVVAFGIALCSTANTGNDEFMQEYSLDRIPDFIQSEMLWESTQALGDRMSLAMSAMGDSALYDNYADAEGTSPLVAAANRTALEEYNVGAGTPLLLRVFNAPVEGTRPMDPLTGNCVPRPVLGGCLTGLGATLNQEFTVYTHVFHNTLPEEGWQFSVDGHPPYA